jgi:hypothetical protein
MYRQVDPKRNVIKIESILDDSIMERIKKDNEKHQHEKEQFLKIKSLITLRFYHEGLPPQLIQMNKSSTIKEATVQFNYLSEILIEISK